MEARPPEVKRPSHTGQMLGRVRRGACKEQLSSPKASGVRVHRGGRVRSTAVNPSLERYFPCGVIFSCADLQERICMSVKSH